MDKQTAQSLATSFGFQLGDDFHRLDSSTVDKVLAAAKAAKYRHPKNANGSKARYFYAFLNRAKDRN